MKGMKTWLVLAVVAAPFAAQAELKSIDDGALSEVSGQSGLVIEAGFGSTTAQAGVLGVESAVSGSTVTTAGAFADFSNAGITIDSFKWQVDVETFDSATNTVSTTATGLQGGFIAQDIAIAGAVDVYMDGAEDLGAQVGGLSITFGANSVVDFRIGNMAFYNAANAAFGMPNVISGSLGSIEIIGMDISGLDLLVRGNGVRNY